jgi:hypothetical protein
LIHSGDERWRRRNSALPGESSSKTCNGSATHNESKEVQSTDRRTRSVLKTSLVSLEPSARPFDSVGVPCSSHKTSTGKQDARTRTNTTRRQITKQDTSQDTSRSAIETENSIATDARTQRESEVRSGMQPITTLTTGVVAARVSVALARNWLVTPGCR